MSGQRLGILGTVSVFALLVLAWSVGWIDFQKLTTQGEKKNTIEQVVMGSYESGIAAGIGLAAIFVTAHVASGVFTAYYMTGLGAAACGFYLADQDPEDPLSEVLGKKGSSERKRCNQLIVTTLSALASLGVARPLRKLWKK